MSKDNILEPTHEEKAKNGFSRLSKFVVGGIGRGIGILASAFCSLLPKSAREGLSKFGKKAKKAFSGPFFKGFRAGITSVLAGIALCVVSTLMGPGVIGALFIAAGVGFILVGLAKGAHAYFENNGHGSPGEVAENVVGQSEEPIMRRERNIGAPCRGHRHAHHRRRGHRSGDSRMKNRSYSSDYEGETHDIGRGWRDSERDHRRARNTGGDRRVGQSSTRRSDGLRHHRRVR